MATIAVRRSDVSRSLVLELSDRFAGGESLVIVGPRHSGKSWLMGKVTTKLEEAGIQVSQIHLQGEIPLSEAQAVVRIGHASGLPQVHSIDGFFAAVEAESNRQLRPVVLAIHDLDGLEREMARKVLRGVRAGVLGQWLVVAITGESHIFDLVNGPDSEFNCSNEFILQGMEETLYFAEGKRWAERLGVEFDDRDRCLRKAYELTGGNLSFLRRLLHSAVDRALNETNESGVTLLEAEMQKEFDHLLSLGTYGSIYFQQAGELIASNPDCWPTLLEMMQGRRPPLKTQAPDFLELAGVALGRQGRLDFSSPLMKRFVVEYFGPRRRGDLEALSGDFESAFLNYRESGVIRSYRPSNFQDGLVVTSIVRRLCRSFRESTLENLKLYLHNALELILGFRYISYLSQSEGGVWREDPGDHRVPKDHRIPKELWRFLHRLQPAPGRCALLGEDVRASHGIAVALADPGGAQLALTAFVVWEPSSRPISIKRMELLQELCEEYASAYMRTVSAQWEHRKDLLQARLDQTSTRVFSGLFVEHTNPASVLRESAASLLSGEAPFKRVVVLLADERNEIWWPVLCQPQIPGWSEVPGIAMGDLIRVMGKERLLTARPAQLFHEKGVVLPWLEPLGVSHILTMTGRGGAALGVLLLETSDVHLEWEGLSNFADRLGAAIEQGERLAFILGALDQIADALVLFNRGDCVVYANEPARKVLGLAKAGWQPSPVELDPQEYESILRAARTSRIDGHRVAIFESRLLGRPYRAIVVADALRTESSNHGPDRPAFGSLVHIPDQSYYEELLSAIQVLHRASDVKEALDGLMEVLRQQGHSWIRHYNLEDGKLMPGVYIDPDRPQRAAAFQEVRIPGPDQSPFSYAAILRKEPQVFYYLHQGQAGVQHGRTFYTPRGLAVTAIEEPPESEKLGKRPGDYWIDFPLMVGPRVTGKLTLPCSVDLSPERVEMLRALAALGGKTLEQLEQQTIRGNLQLQRTLERMRRTTVEQVAHVSTFLARLEEFRSVDGVGEAISQLHADLTELYKEIMTVVPGTAARRQGRQG